MLQKNATAARTRACCCLPKLTPERLKTAETDRHLGGIEDLVRARYSIRIQHS